MTQYLVRVRTTYDFVQAKTQYDLRQLCENPTVVENPFKILQYDLKVNQYYLVRDTTIFKSTMSYGKTRASTKSNQYEVVLGPLVGRSKAMHEGLKRRHFELSFHLIAIQNFIYQLNVVLWLPIVYWCNTIIHIAS